MLSNVSYHHWIVKNKGSRGGTFLMVKMNAYDILPATMFKLLSSYFIGLRNKESRLSANVAEEDHTNKEREVLSPDGKRKYTFSLAHQVGDPNQPIQSVKFSARTSDYSWNTILQVERGIAEDQHVYTFICIDVPRGKVKESSYGLWAWYDADGVLDVDSVDAGGWALLGADTPESALLFQLGDLPQRLNMRKTGEAFFEQVRQAIQHSDMKYFQKPILFPAIAGDISINDLPGLNQ